MRVDIWHGHWAGLDPASLLVALRYQSVSLAASLIVAAFLGLSCRIV